MVIWHLEEIGKVKKLNKWVPHELTANQKIVVLKCLFSCCMQQWTISQSDCGVQNKWIVHNNQQCPAQWLDWEEAPKHFPKPNLHPPQKKGYGHCLMVCCSSDPLQLSKSWQNHHIWEVCSANWCDISKTATPAASTGQQERPNSSTWQRPVAHCTTNTSEAEWKGLQKFCLICHIHLTSCQQLPLLSASQQRFAGETLPQPAEGRKYLPKVHWILKHRFLC